MLAAPPGYIGCALRLHHGFRGNVPTDVETRAEVGASSLERQARGVNSRKEATP